MNNFNQYDQENPNIYEKFKELTFQAINKGFDYYGAKSIFELIRWHSKESGNDAFKINNNYAPDYARKFTNEFPQYKNFFRTRQLKKLR